MASTSEQSKRVLKLIRRSDLVYPDYELLECFLNDSKDPEQTARYILRRCSVAEDAHDLDPGALLADWKTLIAFFMTDGPAHQLSDKVAIAAIFKRDGGKCRITELANSFWDPLIVAPLLPFGTFHLDKGLNEMLGIYIGSGLLDWFSSKAASLNTYQSHWLVRRSAAAALSQGCFKIDFWAHLPELEYQVISSHIGSRTLPPIARDADIIREDRFPDPSASNVDNPDKSALQLVSMFSAPIRWTLLSREIARKELQIQPIRNWQTASLWRFLVDRGAAVMSTALRLLPAFVRIRAYRGLAFLGRHMYGPSSFGVQRLPFGMYFKQKRVDRQGSLENEYAALQLVSRHTRVPVPMALDVVSDSKYSYLLTSRVPGTGLGSCLDALSHSEEEALVRDLQEALSQLRAIPKRIAPEYAISNVLGKACFDGRIEMHAHFGARKNRLVGPFVDEAEFHNRLREIRFPNILQREGHQIVFTHGDLHSANILMHNGRLSGIIDWETAGWFPEYWEYTKACYISRINRYFRILNKVMEPFGTFEKELEIETKMWVF
ncbi:hypothetical protein E4U43_003453 [Claviceps pusilla]|uniref:Aminoglycoside phosphotransferase domain-containing protein n=1 Tax=Claviceps pusilla TaxID=123648 RepID=A0A9P7N4P6_9HYPO|nr:hypothetical protein E4U43_003453 [Claviceps pusilla]